MTQVSVVLPTFNERDNLPILIARLADILAFTSFEVIVVDDNSPDGTWDVARKLADQYPFLSVIRRLHARGLSSAVLDGFASADGRYLVVMDADLQHDETILPQLIAALDDGADISVGSRKVNGAGTKDWSLVRVLVSNTATLMARFVLPVGVTDPMSGFFALRREVYEDVATRMNPRGFKILLEFVGRSPGKTVREVGYVFKGRIHGESKLSSKVMLEFIAGLYDLRFGRWLPLPLLKYLIVGASGVIVNQMLTWVGLSVLGLSRFDALALGIETSIITNFALNNFWTFRARRLRGPLALVRGFLSFNAICLAGAIINLAVGLTLADWLRTSVYLTNFAGIALATLWNYFINTNVTWAPPALPGTGPSRQGASHTPSLATGAAVSSTALALFERTERQAKRLASGAAGAAAVDTREDGTFPAP